MVATIEIFKTNVQGDEQAERLLRILMEHFPGSDISFDLEDCDKILRIKNTEIIPGKIIDLLDKHGFACEALQD